ITRTVGAKDLVESGVSGFVLSADPSVSEMATALNVLLDRNKRLHMGEHGRQVALQYTWKNAVDRVAHLYYQLATGGSG
ncbi:MAG: hypothetical protein ACFFCW_35215, partial [Candidatus Hodarchaeota archaeon]